MEQAQPALNIDRRPPVDRSDLKTRTVLFRQHVAGLLRRNPDRLIEICSKRSIIGDSTEDLIEGLVALFANETHYRRRNNLINQVSHK